MIGKLLGVVIWGITIGALALFIGRYWWFPKDISEHGGLFHSQFTLTLVVVGVAFTMAQMALGYLLIRYGAARKGSAVYTHGSKRLEVVWTAATGVVFVILAVLGQRVWAHMYFQEAPADAVIVEVTGQQFAWNFRYPGADGEFGPTKAGLIDDSAGNPLGVDESDPTSKDDVVSSTMSVPVNRPVKLVLRSKDVIHSLFIPVLRFKQDAVPGMAINMHFKAMETGRYEIACTELCGLGHYKMRTFIDVMSQEDFDKWLAERAPNR